VRVNDVRWPEVDGLVWLGPRDRGYVSKIDDEDKVTITFGDGQHGTRLPTGPENVRAEYRVGIGRPGNVAARSISLLATRPLGVKEVINPLPASGGADREGPDQARQNAPLAVMALDRLVSVQDYADFCRTFAGIAKASATRLSDGRRRVVHLTLAGADDIAIDPNSDLYRNLRQALHRLGDPFQAIEMEGRERMLLVMAARVRIEADYEWESVEPGIRTALLETFGFERRALGQDVVPGEVLSAIQAVPGVAYVDLDLLDTVSEGEAADPSRLTIKLRRLAGDPFDEFERIETPALGHTLQKRRALRGVAQRIVVQMARVQGGEILPAQLAVLDPELPDTLILTELS
ncbi:MAG: putative baseplate assembly protein, partial [Anaerolineae bacterium]|jgi:predicted phage baseplate assembly protein